MEFECELCVDIIMENISIIFVLFLSSDVQVIFDNSCYIIMDLINARIIFVIFTFHSYLCDFD